MIGPHKAASLAPYTPQPPLTFSLSPYYDGHQRNEDSDPRGGCEAQQGGRLGKLFCAHACCDLQRAHTRHSRSGSSSTPRSLISLALLLCIREVSLSSSTRKLVRLHSLRSRISPAHSGWIIAGQDATEAFFSLHRHEVLLKPQYMRLQIGTIEGESQQIKPLAAGELSKVPYAEPTWLSPGFFSPYYSEVSGLQNSPEHSSSRRIGMCRTIAPSKSLRASLSMTSFIPMDRPAKRTGNASAKMFSTRWRT